MSSTGTSVNSKFIPLSRVNSFVKGKILVMLPCGRSRLRVVFRPELILDASTAASRCCDDNLNRELLSFAITSFERSFIQSAKLQGMYKT